MAEDGLHAVTSCRGGLDAEEGDSEPSMLLQKLKTNISKNIQGKVDSILQDVQRFSDNDKLYLYLQLPSGPVAGEKSGSSDSSSLNMADQLHTCNWIRSHLEEHADTCLPKQDVYEAYKRYCDNLRYRPLSAANFGKIIRDIFPNIKARRLGGRGQSKYCYSGIRRKTVLNMPLFPNLDLKNDPSELTELVQTYKQEVTEAACELICDWAEKILKRSFDTVVEIARFLVQEHIVNPRWSQAELVTSATLAGGPAKPHKVIKKTPVLPKGGGTEGEGSGSDHKNDKDGVEQASSGKLTTAEKQAKAAEAGRSGGRDLQVEAVMKRFPPLVPRGTFPDKTPLPHRSSPPTLAPKDAGGVKVTVPIAMATLPQQHGAPLPLFNMILPSGMSLSYSEREKPPAATVATATPTSVVVQRARSAPRRAPEPVAVDGSVPMKRMRGRPRKTRPEEAGQPPAQTPAPAPAPPTRGVIQKALPFSSAPSQQPQPEMMEIVIGDQRRRLLGTLADSAVDGAKSSVLQCYRPEAGASSQAVQTRPYPVLLLPSTGPPLSRAAVEVIRRAPLTGEGRSYPEVPTVALSTLLEEKDEVEITLNPVDSLSEPLLAPGTGDQCPQPDASSPTHAP